MEETLIHMSKDSEKADALIQVKKLGVKQLAQPVSVTIGIHLRPFVRETLRSLKQKYELILFSSSSKEITNRVADILEKEEEFFSFRLSRESCFMTDNNLFIKDLRIINRQPERMLLVDDSTYGFGFQLENGVPIIPFTGAKDDAELIQLEQYIDFCFGQNEDVRKCNKEYFKWGLYSAASSTEDLVHKLFK